MNRTYELHDAKGGVQIIQEASNLRREPMLTRVKELLFPSAGHAKEKRKKKKKGLLPEFDRRYIAIIFAARKGAVDGPRRRWGHPS